MCLTVGYHCSICDTRSREIYRCITKVRVLQDPPCRRTRFLNNEQEGYICITCAACGETNKDTIAQRMVEHQSKRVDLVRLVMTLDECVGYTYYMG